MMTTTPTELCSALQERRLAAGITQRQAASEFGVTGGAYNRWEQGTTIPAFDAELVEKMREFLALDADEMDSLIVRSIVAWNARRADR